MPRRQIPRLLLPEITGDKAGMQAIHGYGSALKLASQFTSKQNVG
jgi:hypothetical protein